MTATHLLPSLTTENYADAVASLLEIAVKDCGGSKPCAMVLLNAYNCDITDLCCLDEKRYSAALVVIRCRAELCREPHEFIENGDRVFDALWMQWKRHSKKTRR
ncbi:hypothetical protein V3O24_04490 [Methylobacter sp. Wu8]|uniref:DUF7673 family protein n=1 Tax=Methylobacter sp. Wu8 TaxID=3118457 RepID=UPI002F33BAD4